MIKSLKSLKFGTWTGGCSSLADEIQAEIDKYYLPRPLFEDGEPADFGMGYVTGRGEVEKIETFVFSEEDVDINPSNPVGQQVGWSTWWKRPLRHSVESDTQEKIDADAHLSLLEYCAVHHLTYANQETTSIAVRMHLLARQKKLDGVNDA